jgi:spermidine synthase
MRRSWNLSKLDAACSPRLLLFWAGCAAIVGQVVLLREMMALFNGNELCIGIVLALWMAWTALGSGVAGRYAQRVVPLRAFLAVLLCIAGVSLPFALCVLRIARAAVQTAPGELLGPAATLLIALVCLAPLCLANGALYALAQRWNPAGESKGVGASDAYLWETAGSCLGALLFTFLLLALLGPLQIAALALAMNLLLATLLLIPPRRLASGLLLCSASVLLAGAFFRTASVLDLRTEQALWKGFDLLEVKDSVHARLTAVGTGPLRSLYVNGAILANLPDPAAAEESIHFALLDHPAPHAVLLIGGSLNGGIAEALKHPSVQRIDAVELDPDLVRMGERLLPGELARSYHDPRVHLHLSDGRVFLKEEKRSFDAILVNLPDPDNAQWNRFYTAEFFRLARSRLNPGGVLAVSVRSAEETIGPELAEYMRCIYATLGEVFPGIAIVPGETTHFIASAQPASTQANTVAIDPAVLIARMKERRLQTQYLSEYILPYRLAPDRVAQLRAALQSTGPHRINRDFYPAAYYFATELWTRQFNRVYARGMERASHLHFGSVLKAVLLASLALLALVSVRPAKGGRGRIAPFVSVLAAGFTLMTLQMLLLLCFQSICGYLYRDLALMMGMFMGGVAAGAWAGRARLRVRGRRVNRAAAINQMLLALTAPVLLAAVGWLASVEGSHSLFLLRALFPGIALLCGIPGGVQFALAARSEEATPWDGSKPARGNAALLYAMDLIGGCVAALLLAGFVVPLFGFWNAAWLAVAVNLAPALLFLFQERPVAP